MNQSNTTDIGFSDLSHTTPGKVDSIGALANTPNLQT